MMKIYASLLAADTARLGEEVRRADQAGVDGFHFDLMDGHYVPNLALTPQHLKDLRVYTGLPFSAHLELANPDDILHNFNPLGAELVIVQWDTLPDPHQTIGLIRSQGAQVGLGVNPGEALEISQDLWGEIDMLLILGVEPGFGGQAMRPGAIAKVAEARKWIDRLGLNLTIAVDGGARLENIPALLRAGANPLVMGTALFNAPDMADVVKSIRNF